MNSFAKSVLQGSSTQSLQEQLEIEDAYIEKSFAITYNQRFGKVANTSIIPINASKSDTMHGEHVCLQKNMSPSERTLVRDSFLGPHGVHVDQMINPAYVDADNKGMAFAGALSNCVRMSNIFALYHDLGLTVMSSIEFLLFAIHQRSRDTRWDPKYKRWRGLPLIVSMLQYRESDYCDEMISFHDIYEAGQTALDRLPVRK